MQQYNDLSGYLNSTNKVKNQTLQMYFYVTSINGQKLFFAAITDWQKIIGLLPVIPISQNLKMLWQNGSQNVCSKKTSRSALKIMFSNRITNHLPIF